MTEVPLDEKRQANLENWEDRVPVHLGPDGYPLDEFDDPDHLSRVVRFDLPRLGDLRDVDVIHLQCHIGTDTVSLDRLGAQSVTGYDFSPAAIEAARDLAKRSNSKTLFVHGESYDAATALGTAGPTRFEEALSYEGDGTALAHTTTYQWNWSIREIVTALIDARLHIDWFTEHRTVPWNALEGAMVAVGPLGEYELADRPERLACTFTLLASLQA